MCFVSECLRGGESLHVVGLQTRLTGAVGSMDSIIAPLDYTAATHCFAVNHVGAASSRVFG